MTNGDFLDKIDLKDFFFQLVKTNKEPIKIEIEFFANGKYYIYSVEILHSQKNTINEYLRLSGVGEKEDEIIFVRNGNHVSPSTDSKLSE